MSMISLTSFKQLITDLFNGDCIDQFDNSYLNSKLTKNNLITIKDIYMKCNK